MASDHPAFSLSSQKPSAYQFWLEFFFLEKSYHNLLFSESKCSINLQN